MRSDAPAQTVERVRSVLGMLDRAVRAKALEAVTQRALVLTDGQVEGDGALAVALARAALGALDELPPDDGDVDPDIAPADRNEAEARLATRSSERRLRSDADRIDLALVALRGATELLGAWNNRYPRELIDQDKLLEVTLQMAVPTRHRLIREQALLLVARLLAKMPVSERLLVLGLGPLRLIRQYAMGQGASRFVQRAALEVLIAVRGPDVEADLREVLESSRGHDGMLIRHHVVSLLPASALSPAQQLACVWEQRGDPSEHVRQGVVRALTRLGTIQPKAFSQLADLACADTCPRISGLALVELGRLTGTGNLAARAAFERLLAHACQGKDPVLHRASIAALRDLSQTPFAAPLAATLAGALEAMIQNARLDTAEMAALLAREVALLAEPKAQALCEALRTAAREQPEGKPFVIQLDPALDEAHLEQAAVVAASLDLALEIIPRRDRQYELCRGERRGFRVWRWMHELGHRVPDKRQSYLHTHARLARPYTCTIPIRQAEVTPTLVPGERRILFGSSWGCFMPRIDDLFAACNAPNGKRLISALGALCIRAPESRYRRWRLSLLLTRRYAELAELRDSSLVATTGDGKRRFTLEIKRLGFSIEYKDTDVRLAERSVSTLPPSVHQYLSLALPLPVALWLEDALQYLVSPSGNTAWHLAIVVWVVLAFMVGRAANISRRFARARREIPFSIGGWGSRGKSGTERLKSALFHSAHMDVVSKTTGCEAMLILARRDQTAHEIFLYRPYDKATIWEQANVVQYAQSLGAQVFLWECMALQPEFVDILNREWMKDPITTITNAYPDHEDIMGPSGEDVARVIARFIPVKGTVFSSEEQMEALIRESAIRRGTHIIEVDDLAADLLPRDMLERFPYQEHPKNVALALRLAEHLGFSRERALVDIADYVVPDLGVLNTFPKIVYKTRSIVFSNGMSANERAGFMSNWNRLYYVTHDPDKMPDTVLMGVINNRADRVPRSRVFADVFARDVAVDRMVVIGTNQFGMQRFMAEGISVEAGKIVPPESASDAPDWIGRIFDKLGAPKLFATVERRVRNFATALLGPEPKPEAQAEIEAHVKKLAAAIEDPNNPDLNDLEPLPTQLAAAIEPLCQSLATLGPAELTWAANPEERKLEHQKGLASLIAPWLERRYWTARLAELIDPAKSPPLLERLRRTYCDNFNRRVIVLEDHDSTGDQVVDFIYRQIPAGHHSETMGCQNIKGTGLDFVYRFVELQRAHDWLGKLELEPTERTNILNQMKTHIDYGLFGCQYTMKWVNAALADPKDTYAPERRLLEELLAHLLEREKFFIGKLGKSKTKSRWAVVLGKIEPWVDNLDGIRRRKRAERIMADLIDGNLDTATAAQLLRNVVARQKGGWLAKDFTHFFSRSEAQR